MNKRNIKKIFNVTSVFFLFFAYATIVLAAPPPSEDVDLDGDPRWEVTYTGREYDAVNDQTTFSYTVNVTGDPALSHLTLGFPLCDANLSVVDYFPVDAVTIGLDPTTGVDGIKWDIGLDSTDSTRDYSYTLSGNISEGTVEVAVKAGRYSATGDRTGPGCGDAEPPSTDTFSISGTVFIDADQDGINDLEPGVENVTVVLINSDGELVATAISDDSGNYTFTDVSAGGDYEIVVLSENEIEDFNEILFNYFDTTNSTVIKVTNLAADSTGNNFGFAPDTLDITNDLLSEDPDADGFTFEGTGKTIGFWKHQNAVAIKRKGRAQIDAETLQSYIDAIEELFLPDPFQFDDSGEYQAAFDILKMRTSDAAELLLKQLLGTEFNQTAGLGLSGDYAALQTVLISWGEYLAAFSTDYTREELITAKDIFDLINNSGE